ncbi:hypothetical protein Ancab_011745, partial [Ancistrocladus abbreviatus]
MSQAHPAAAGAAAASTRWCPTPEQLMILEEMYRGGIKTPNAAQIQQITAHLSLYGKIEGKNVFYWFQNHKARDRQKLRRRLTKQLMLQHQHQLQLYQQSDYFHQQQNSNHLLHYFPEPPAAFCPPPPAAAAGFHHQLSHRNSPTFLAQEQMQYTSCGPRMIDYTWKVEVPEAKETKKRPISRSDGDDWVIITEVGPTSACCTPTNNRPLKTLQLFPVKDESSTSSDLPPAGSLHPSSPT